MSSTKAKVLPSSRTMNQRLIDTIEQSFFCPLLIHSSITDISFNGESLYYMDNRYGRLKSTIDVTVSQVTDFLRQIANLSEQQFSYSHPILDVSIGHYRLNAVHGAIARAGYERVTTFSLRVGNTNPCLIQPNQFFHPAILDLLQALIKAQVAIVIAGQTSSGKTELQKYLFQLMEENTRIIVIDNIQELEGIRHDRTLDITCWQKNDEIKDANFSTLIANGLRSNPDWLCIAEARGKEMLDILNAAMTGHSLILTAHSLDLVSLPSRLTRMVLMGDPMLRYEDVKKDIEHHFTFYLYLERRKNEHGEIIRYIKEVAEVRDGEVSSLYQKEGANELFGKMSEGLQKRIGGYLKKTTMEHFKI